MERAAWLERRYGAEVEWRPFDLHPEYPPEGIPRSELERRYGAGLADRHRAMFEPLGLPFAGTLEKVPNSRGALMVGELARERGVFAELHPRLFEAYWGRGRDIGNQDVLIDEGGAVGLDESEISEVLQNSRYLRQVENSTREAMEIGAGGVPAWVIDRRVLVPGAQPHEVFDQVLERLGHAPVEGP